MDSATDYSSKHEPMEDSHTPSDCPQKLSGEFHANNISGHSKLRSLETLNKPNLLSAVHIMKKFSLVFQHLFIEQCVAMRNNREIFVLLSILYLLSKESALVIIAESFSTHLPLVKTEL
uniref:Uncharacterized protein n=1 Tax=Glossina pallidipes TaxID=7398 RepID=A0A1B0AH28_GLOPL